MDTEDFSDAKLVGPVKSANPAEGEILSHFMKDLDALKETPEELAAELHALRSRLKADKDREEKILFYFKSKKDRGLFNLGGYVMKITEEKGRTSTDWEQFILDAEGPEGVADAKKKYSKTGAPIIKVSVEKFQS